MVGVAEACINFIGDGVALGGGPGVDGVGGEGNGSDAAGYHNVVYTFPFVIVKVAAFCGDVIAVIGKP